ncbi:MAG: hypothetical protein F4Z31_00700 [Gemmatimonadetes bacterium]|nr:hypothetical protein [Gemmatimonadota bacterium]MYE92209.1 hypothetical protein [Gemmatimonadota bacterium]MYJ12672.1 hypothetical protein [Gemmatimonadota bacterium]
MSARSWVPGWVVAAVAAVALGCGGADTPPGPLADSVDAPERLFAVDSLGSTEGDDSFGGIVDVALSPEGVLAVSQFGLGEVWVFDAMGRRQVVGRSGQGPGEFGSVPHVAWWGDTLLVVDGGRSRVSLMAGDGRYLRGHATGPRSAAARYGPVGYLRSGLTVAAPRTTSSSTPEPNPILLVGTDGQILDSLGEARHRRVSAYAALPNERGFVFLNPLANYTRTELSPDGRYFGTADELEGPDGSELRFVLYDDTGNQLGRTAVGVETDPASDDDVLERTGDIVESLSTRHGLPVASVRKSILEAVQAPDRLPALSRFLVDNAGNLWVGSIVKGGRVVWRAWNIEGDLVRMWIADPDLELKQIHDGGAVAVRRDDVRGWRVVFVRPRGAG